MTDTSTQSDEQRGWREVERRRVQRTRRILVGALVVLIVLLLIASYALLQIFQPVGKVASPAESNGVTWVRSIYGWGKAPSEQFVAPQGVGIGPDGIIWATTQGQSRVVGFNPDGSFNAMLYQGPKGDPKYPNAFTFPTAVAVDPSGLIYITDQPRSTVWVMSRDNKIVRSIFVPTPMSVAVSNDRLVVGSASGFVVLTPTGQVIKVVGTQGKGIDQFQAVRGVLIGKDGTIFVTDQFNNRLSAYDRNGVRKWIIVLGNPGNQQQVKKSTKSRESSAVADMQIPAGMTMDGAGRIVIADPFGFDFGVFDAKNGKILAKYGNPGTSDGQFVYPSDISYDPAHDWFAVADTQNGRVQIIRIPNSGGTALSGVNRALTGPIRACIIPLLLIVLTIVGGIIYRVLNRRKRRAAASEADGAEAEQEPVDSVE
jgi:sugar lactone lactonase YvrE